LTITLQLLWAGK